MARRQATAFKWPGITNHGDGRTSVAPGSFWVQLPLGDEEPHGDWMACYRIAEQDGQLVVSEIRIVPWPRGRHEDSWVSKSLEDHPDLGTWVEVDDEGNVMGPSARPPAIPAGGLSARAAKAGIRTGEALERAREKFVMTAHHNVPLHNFSAEALATPRRPGRRGRPERFYAEVAAMYDAAVNANGSRTPIRDITKQLASQGHYYAESSVTSIVNRARDRGFLTRGRRGMPGGRLTDKAQELLKIRS